MSTQPVGPNIPNPPNQNGGTDWGQIIGYGVGALGAYAGYKGQQDTNAANAQMAKDQMAFQERMRNTSWQSAVDDMKKAGLNPALAYQQGGAATPSGSTAQMGNKLGAGAASAQGAVQSFQNMRATAAMIQNTAADTIKKGAEANLAGAQASIQDAIYEYDYRKAVKDTDSDMTPMRIHLDRETQRAQINNTINSAALTAAQTGTEGERKRLTGGQADITKEDLARAKAESAMYTNKYGKLAPWVPPITGAAGAIRNFLPKY